MFLSAHYYITIRKDEIMILTIAMTYITPNHTTIAVVNTINIY